MVVVGGAIAWRTARRWSCHPHTLGAVPYGPPRLHPLLCWFRRSFNTSDTSKGAKGPSWNTQGVIIWNDWKPITGEQVRLFHTCATHDHAQPHSPSFAPSSRAALSLVCVTMTTIMTFAAGLGGVHRAAAVPVPQDQRLHPLVQGDFDFDFRNSVMRLLRTLPHQDG